MSNLILFPDTNFFFECVDTPECPWSDITDADEITLVVCRAVRSEIDSRKSSRGRVGSRAQRWTSIFRNASRDGGILQLRAECPRVLLRLAPPVPSPTELPNILDPGRPDDRVIADILAQKVACAEFRDASFFTDDGGAADTARHVGLATIDIPLDGEGSTPWRLPREPDTNERKIRELETRLCAFEAQRPDISLRLCDDAGAEIHHLAFEIVQFVDLGPGQVQELIEKAKLLYPMVTDFPEPHVISDSTTNGVLGALLHTPEVMRYWAIPSKEAINDYWKRDYPSWVKQLGELFSSSHVRLERKTRSFRLSLKIANNGSVSADGFVLTAEALAGLQFSTNDVESRETNTTFPKPPDPPHGIFQNMVGLKSPLLSNPLLRPAIKIPRSDDLHRRQTDSRTKWQWDCAELRHKVEPLVISPLVFAPSTMSLERNAAIRLSLWARNLPEPITRTVPVTFKISKGDTHALTSKIIDDAAARRHLPMRRRHISRRPRLVQEKAPPN